MMVAPAASARLHSARSWTSTRAASCRPSRCRQRRQRAIVERGDDQQDRVGAGRARFEQLIFVDDEVLAQQRNADRLLAPRRDDRASRRRIPARSGPKSPRRRRARSPSAIVNRVVGGPQHASRRRSALALGDHVDRSAARQRAPRRRRIWVRAPWRGARPRRAARAPSPHPRGCAWRPTIASSRSGVALTRLLRRDSTPQSIASARPRPRRCRSRPPPCAMPALTVSACAGDKQRRAGIEQHHVALAARPRR